jgi:hypothetical protein
MQTMLRTTTLVFFAVVMAGAQTPQQKKDPLPDKFMNLKVLPQDISKPELVNTMKSFAQSLGVRCNFCHVGQGDDLSTYDFMSDEKEHKQVARTMLQMVREINQNHLVKLAEDGKQPPRVSCWTCHRGEEEPQLRMPASKPAGQQQAPKEHKHTH